MIQSLRPSVGRFVQKGEKFHYQAAYGVQVLICDVLQIL